MTDSAVEIQVNRLPPKWREYFEERAAIREHDGKQPRPWAEKQALRETLAAMAMEQAKGDDVT